MNHNNTAFQLGLFLMVGVATLAIDIVVSYSLFHFVHLPVYLSSGIGFLSGFFFNFPMNRKRVFQHASNDRFSLNQQILMYAILSMFNLFTTSLAVDLIVNSGMLSIQYAKLAVTGVMAVWNFVIFKTIIFSKKTID